MYHSHRSARPWSSTARLPLSLVSFQELNRRIKVLSIGYPHSLRGSLVEIYDVRKFFGNFDL